MYMHVLCVTEFVNSIHVHSYEQLYAYEVH